MVKKVYFALLYRYIQYCMTTWECAAKHRWRNRGDRIGLGPPCFYFRGGLASQLFGLDIVSLSNTISIGSSDKVNRSMKKTLQNFCSILSIIFLTYYL